MVAAAKRAMSAPTGAEIEGRLAMALPQVSKPGLLTV